MTKVAFSVFDSWAQYIADILQKEYQLSGSMIKHGGELGGAREALIKGVLNRIIPKTYEIGSGEIVDNLGNHSKQIDIVIARHDFPSLSLPNGSKLYLIEAVLATIEVKSTLNRKNLTEALDNCASVAELCPNVVAGRLRKIAQDGGLKEIKPGIYQHTNPLETARFDLLGRPVSYVFGFKGYKRNPNALARVISAWVDKRNKKNINTSMNHHPAVIAGAGCFGWRNSSPYIVNNNIIMRIGIDKNPIRLLVLHLLFTLKTKIIPIPDSSGLVPNLDVYLRQMEPFTTTIGVGQCFNRKL